MTKKNTYILLILIILVISLVFVYFFLERETPEKAVKETIASVLNKDYHLFIERVDLPVVTNYVYSKMVIKKKDEEDGPQSWVETITSKITKSLMVLFADSNKEEISNLMSDYLLRDSIPNSSFNKEIFFEFLDNIEKQSLFIKLLKKDPESFSVRIDFYQRVIDKKLSVDIYYQLRNKKWVVTEIENIPRISAIYLSEKKMVLQKKFQEQQMLLKRYLLVEEIRISTNQNIIGSLFKIRVKLKNIGKEEIYGYAIKIGYHDIFGKINPYEILYKDISILPGETNVIVFEPKFKFLDFKLAEERGDPIDSEIIYINLQNETIKSFSEQD